jgi:hypothetical protein
MTDPASDTARSAAAILAPEVGASLPAQVDAILTARATSRRPGQFTVDPVSVASLIVAIATLAWTIYDNLHARTHEPPQAETIARKIHMTLREEETSVPPGTVHIIEVIATEIIHHASPRD